MMTQTYENYVDLLSEARMSLVLSQFNPNKISKTLEYYAFEEVT